MDILSKILYLVDENNMEQREFASLLGIAPATISHWKTGKSKSYLKYISQIADYFGVSADYLLGTSNIELESPLSKDATLDKIMYLIESHNLEQRELASALGILPETITNWKAGRSKSYLKYIPQISSYFGVSTDYLLGNDELELQNLKENMDIPVDGLRSFLVVKGVLKPGEPLSEELKNTCTDIMFQLLESNYDQYKNYFMEHSWKS